MLKSVSEGEKKARTILVGNSKRRTDLEMYGLLPDYGEFQGYDLGIDTDLSQIAEKIYADMHNPSCGTLKRHLLMV